MIELSDCAAPQPAIRLVRCWCKSSFRIVNVWHTLVDTFLSRIMIVVVVFFFQQFATRTTRLWSKSTAVVVLVGLVLVRASFHETALDAQPSIRQVLAAVVANLLVPVAIAALFHVTSNYCGSFLGGVDSNAAILVIHLGQEEEEEEEEAQRMRIPRHESRSQPLIVVK